MPGRRFVMLLCALLAVVTTSCGGDDAPRTPTMAPSATVEATSAVPTASPSSGPAKSPTPAVVTRTEVIIFAPPPSAPVTVTGNCFGLSLPVARLGAWRCMASNEIYDPCFGAPDARQVICVQNPAKPDDAVRMDLLSRACENAVLGNALCLITAIPAPPEPRPWAFRLPSGAVCMLLQGTLGQYEGDLVPYSCEDGTTIIGYPSEDTVWTAEVVDRDGRRVATPLVTVWQ